MIKLCQEAYSDLIKKRKLALVHSNFAYAKYINVAIEFKRKVTTKPLFDIGLLDLGFSSYQLADSNRGISYMDDEQYIDMRYDTSVDEASTAHDIVNSSPVFDLVQIFHTFGEERYA